MNESSQIQTKSIFFRVPIQWIIFIIQGVFLVCFNMLIIASIAKYKQLRTKKEYLLFGALALSDALSGFGYFLLGSYRLWVAHTDQIDVKMSSWRCMKCPHNWFLAFGGPLSGLMLTCVSLDRLVCVGSPVTYYKLRSGYAWKMIGVFYSGGIVSFVFLVVTSYLQSHEPNYSKLCYTTNAIGNPGVKQYFLVSRASGGMASVIIYLFVLPFHNRFRKIMFKENSRSDQLVRRDVERQKKLSHTVRICVFFTFVLFVLPNVAKSFFNTMALKDRPTAIIVLSGYASCIQNLNPILNIFLYALKLQDMRKGMKAFILCKEMNQVHITLSKCKPSNRCTTNK